MTRARRGARELRLGGGAVARAWTASILRDQRRGARVPVQGG
eukprot:CAMPEP_0174906624 /NCGR_PEP_ID=MMETSP0167-20121228/57824_1 /TAXON_ID=38298 /ORGANISM="Rhodella maculata, Strain CCMP736" /LENGTH=41 /DNA_ID= /DNA_START= /DNA_END= /DNA_ORIENTATION=